MLCVNGMINGFKEGISINVDDRGSAIKLKIVKSAVNRTYNDLYIVHPKYDSIVDFSGFVNSK